MAPALPVYLPKNRKMILSGAATFSIHFVSPVMVRRVKELRLPVLQIWQHHRCTSAAKRLGGDKNNLVKIIFMA